MSLVVLILVASQDAVDTAADHLQEAVLREVGVAGVIKGRGESPHEGDLLIELADGEQSGVAGQLALERLDDRWRAEETEDFWPGVW